MQLNKTTTILLITVLAALLFIPFLGRVHLFDGDEINFAECSREMIKMNDYTRVYVDFKPFWEKPPMFFWMQSTAMKAFGINEFAARFPNAISLEKDLATKSTDDNRATHSLSDLAIMRSMRNP